LEQHVHFEEGTTVHEAALAAFENLQSIEHEMHQLEHRMAEAGDDLDRVLERYSELQHEFERLGGFEYAARAEAILQGLGFERETWSMETAVLSGGQKNRLGLARLLLAEPDVLLLDEPTNHLDVAAVEWLEEFLASYRSAYIIISHDRYFLDRACTRIVEIEHGRAASYQGNYSHFVVEREERREIAQRAYENQQQLIAKTEEFIRRNLAGQKTKQAKSRRTMLARLERVEAVRPDAPQGNFQLQKVERAGTYVLTVKDAAVGYPGKLLASDIEFVLKRGECLGIIGPNGSGKTTFLKTVLGKLPQLAGEIRWGTNVTVGYYAQQLDDLDDRNEIIMELRRVAPSTATAGELRGFLARFLFTGDDVYKQVRDLSGGEKGRLALAKLIYSNVNVLVLDEPTNHLDIPSREALEEALDAYEGTILTISHDRYFLDRVATQILALDGEGGAEYHDGDYTEYHDWKAARRAGEAAKAVVEKAPEPTPARGEAQRPAQSQPKQRAGKESKKKGAARDPQTVEDEIAAAEQRVTALAEELAKPETARDPSRLARVNEDYQKAEARLRELYEEWERAAAEGASA
ncbi:MAG TPA: ABC-F family ATP-binding cassette domain-containing protein, partial [Pyrinomonadaceae bacterium]|nr:ABC-F family ATP-binding cassette domain-containing protein [Pyrinomonadaceae bacterium]